MILSRLRHIDGLFDGKIPTSASATERLSYIKDFRQNAAPALFAKFARNHTYYTPTLVASTYPYSTRLAKLSTGCVDPRDKYVSIQSRQFTDQLLPKYKDDLRPSTIEAELKPFEEFFALVKMMNAAGVPLLAGTDMATSVFYPGFSLHDELALLVQAGLTPMAAIQAATRNPATLLGFKDLGTIAPGNIASMVLLDRNPLADIRYTAEINSVVYQGKLLSRSALDSLLAIGAELALHTVPESDFHSSSGLQDHLH